MSPRARMGYLETIYLQYKKASVRQKTLILNEFCSNCGYHRKHAMRLLNHFKRFTKPTGMNSMTGRIFVDMNLQVYAHDLDAAIRHIQSV